jgi:hypothetical protein
MGQNTKIRVDLETDDQDESTHPSIILRTKTPHTDDWKANVKMYDDIQEISKEGSELDRQVADVFLRDMELLQSELIEESKKITTDEQKKGILIERKLEYKNRLEKGYSLFKKGLEEIATLVKIKTEEDPLERMSKKIKEAKSFTDVCGDRRANINFTSIIKHAQQLRATAKTLQRMANKAFSTKIDEVGHNFFIRRMQYFAGQVILLGDQNRVGERLVDAIAWVRFQS